MDKDNLTWTTKHWDTAQKSLCQYSLGRTLLRIMRLNRFKTLKITPGFLSSMGNWSWNQLSLLMGNRLFSGRHSNCRFLPALHIGLIPPPPTRRMKNTTVTTVISHQRDYTLKLNAISILRCGQNQNILSIHHYITWTFIVSAVKYYEE